MHEQCVKNKDCILPFKLKLADVVLCDSEACVSVRVGTPTLPRPSKRYRCDFSVALTELLHLTVSPMFFYA